MKKVALVAALAGSMFVSTGCSKKAESMDLGKVLDVFVDSMDNFKSSAADSNSKEASDSIMKEFTAFTQKNLNNPSFTEEPVGLELKSNGMFEGFTDKNSNSLRDSGEQVSFTVEIDTERNRLIATDMAGATSGARFSGAGFLAGAILGNLLARQRKAGVKPSSFRNKGSKAKASSSPARSKSFSGSHSSGK